MAVKPAKKIRPELDTDLNDEVDKNASTETLVVSLLTQILRELKRLK